MSNACDHHLKGCLKILASVCHSGELRVVNKDCAAGQLCVRNVDCAQNDHIRGMDDKAL